MHLGCPLFWQARNWVSSADEKRILFHLVYSWVALVYYCLFSHPILLSCQHLTVGISSVFGPTDSDPCKFVKKKKQCYDLCNCRPNG